MKAHHNLKCMWRPPTRCGNPASTNDYRRRNVLSDLQGLSGWSNPPTCAQGNGNSRVDDVCVLVRFQRWREKLRAHTHTHRGKQTSLGRSRRRRTPSNRLAHTLRPRTPGDNYKVHADAARASLARRLSLIFIMGPGRVAQPLGGALRFNRGACGAFQLRICKNKSIHACDTFAIAAPPPTPPPTALRCQAPSTRGAGRQSRGKQELASWPGSWPTGAGEVGESGPATSCDCLGREGCGEHHMPCTRCNTCNTQCGHTPSQSTVQVKRRPNACVQNKPSTSRSRDPSPFQMSEADFHERACAFGASTRRRLPPITG